MPYEERPRFVNTMLREKAWMIFSTLNGLVAAGGLVLGMMAGQSFLGARFWPTALLCTTLVLVGLVLTFDYRGVLVARRMWLALSWRIRRASGLATFDARRLYDAEAELAPVAPPKLALEGSEMLLVPALEDPV